MVDEVLFDAQAFVGGSIQCSFHTIGYHFYWLVHGGKHITLAKDTAVSLLKVHRTDRGIHVVKGYHSVLHVHTHTHLFGTANQHTHITLTGLFKHGFLAFGIAYLTHNDNLFLRNTLFNQLLFDVAVQVELRYIRVVAEQINGGLTARALIAVAEYHLYTLVRCALSIDTHHFAHHLVSLAVGVVRIFRINQTQVNGSLLGLAEYYQWQTGSFIAAYLLFVFLQGLNKHVHHFFQLFALPDYMVGHVPVFQLGNVLPLLEF